MPRFRIKNHYLLKQLGLLVGLGGASVSLQVFVEAWKTKGFEINDEFFLHLDTLESYEFIRLSDQTQKSKPFEDLLRQPELYEAILTVTHNGNEFLHRYG